MRHHVSGLIRSGFVLRYVSLSALCLSLSTVPGSATTSITGSITITTTVLGTCLIVATPLVFASYSGAAVPGTATLTVTCTNTTPYQIALNPGLASGATTSTRKMAFGGVLLNYSLTSDSLHATNWGNNAGVDTVSGTGNGAAQIVSVYGLIPASQYVTPGAYTDTVIATLTY